MPDHTHWWARSTPEACFPPLIVICGATATGKTACRWELASEFPVSRSSAPTRARSTAAWISARPRSGDDDRARFPHHGLDLVDPDEPFTAADYPRLPSTPWKIAARGGVALLVGGTGLYVRAVARACRLTDTGRDVMALRPPSREAGGGGPARPWRAAPNPRANRRGKRDLANRGASFAPSNARRCTATSAPKAPWLSRAIAVDRPEPRSFGEARRIAERARAQFASGLLDEAAGSAPATTPSLPAFSAVGYREAFAVDGEGRSRKNRAEHHPEPPARPPPTDLVPRRAGGEVAGCGTADPAEDVSALERQGRSWKVIPTGVGQPGHNTPTAERL